MKNILFAAAASATLALAAVPAAAQTAFSPTTVYGNLGYSYVDGDDGHLGAITARVGARFGQYLGLEAEGGLGVDGDHTDIGGTIVKTELKHDLAAYVVGDVPVNPKLDLIARVGYGVNRIGASAPGVSLKDNVESWNYGVGGQYFFDVKNGLRAEWTRFDLNDGYGDADVWSLHYVRKF